MNILLVDDKYDVVQGIAQGVDWKSIGDISLYFAYSGEEALELIEKTHIHLLVTDIEMPGMTGLELAARLRKQRQDIGIVFLTSYDSFRYAQNAIRLGCLDYILQPVDYAKLQDSLIRVINQMLTEQIEKDCQNVLGLANPNLVKEEGLWKEIVLRSPFFSEDEMRDLLAEANVYPRVGGVYRMVLANLFWKKETLGNWISHRTEKELQHKMRNALSEVLRVAASFMISSGQWVIIAEDGDCISCLQSFVNDRSDQDGSSLAIFVSDPASLGELPEVYRKLNKLSASNVGRYEGVFGYREAKNTRREKQVISNQLSVPQWKNWLLEGETDRIRQDISRFLKQKDAAKELDKRTLVVIAQLIISTLYSFEARSSEAPMAETVPSEEFISATESVPDLMRFLDEVILKFQEKAGQNCSDGSAGLIKQIKRYVDSHIEDSLNREEIAEKFFISKDYLSHVFIRYEGMGYTQYVNEQRMAKAKELLRSTALPIKIISLNVGIADYAYFSKMFRKSEGISANEYRAKYRSL